MKFLIFGKFSFNHLYFLFYPLCSLGRDILTNFLDEHKVAKVFYLMYIAILSRFLAFIPHLIEKKLSKKKKVEHKNEKGEHKVGYIYNDIQKRLSKNLIKSTLRVAILEFLAEALICIFYFINNKPEVSYIYPMQLFLVINTTTQYIVGHFVLNYHFYKHHILSFVINIFVVAIFLVFDIIEIVNKKITDYQYYIYIIMRLIKLVLFSLEDNYSKQVLHTQFVSPFSLMIFSGIFETIFLLIFSIPFIFIKTRDTGVSIFIDFKEYLKGTNLLISFGILFCEFFFQIFISIIIDRFSPSHLPLGFIIISFLNNIYQIIKNAIKKEETKWNIYLYFLFYIILFIGAMIHNEIFIINKWGFNSNTKLFLIYKLQEEKKISLIKENEDYDDENSGTLGEHQQEIIPLEDISSLNSITVLIRKTHFLSPKIYYNKIVL